LYLRVYILIDFLLSSLLLSGSFLILITKSIIFHFLHLLYPVNVIWVGELAYSWRIVLTGFLFNVIRRL
jgi:hypothetical protein